MNKLTLTQKANSTNQESSLNEDETRSSTLVSIWEIPFYPRKGVCSPSTLPRRKQRLKLLGKKDNKYKKPCIIYAYKWLSWSHLLLGHGIQIVLLRNVILYIKEAIQFYFFFCEENSFSWRGCLRIYWELFFKVFFFLLENTFK